MLLLYISDDAKYSNSLSHLWQNSMYHDAAEMIRLLIAVEEAAQQRRSPNDRSTPPYNMPCRPLLPTGASWEAPRLPVFRATSSRVVEALLQSKLNQVHVSSEDYADLPLLHYCISMGIA